MTVRVAISFDDGFSEQFKWANELYHRGIVGTFYINPAVIGHRYFLNVCQLKEMHDDMHHTIANHLWAHEAPLYGIMLHDAIDSLNRTAAWLREKGFADGCDLLALPYGSVGGEWLTTEITTLLEHCKQVRDVARGGLNDFDGCRYIGACENSKFSYVDNMLILHYFHGHCNTSDDEFVSFLDSLSMYDVEMTSMREIADGHL